MVSEGRVTLPNNEDCAIVFIEACPAGKTPTSVLRFLQSVRSRVVDDEYLYGLEAAYQRELPKMLDYYAEWAQGYSFDALTCLPSSRQDAQPFLNRIAEHNPKAQDLSDLFDKNGDWRSALEPASARQRISLRRQIDASLIRSIAIIDETLRTGSSVAAVIDLLRTQRMPNNAEIILVMPLWYTR